MNGFIGKALLKEGLISEKELKRALEEQQEIRLPLGELLIKLEIVDREAMARFMARFFNIPRITLSDINQNLDKHVARFLPEEMARRHHVIAVCRQGDSILLAMTHPQDVTACESVRVKTGCRVKRAFTTMNEVEEAIDRFYGTLKGLSGEGMVTSRLVTRRQLKMALKDQQEGQKRHSLLGSVISRFGFLAEEDVFVFLSGHLSAPFLRRRRLFEEIDPKVVGLIPEELARKSCVIPVSKKGDVLKIAMAHPDDLVSLEAITKKAGCRVERVMAEEKVILHAIDVFYHDMSYA